MNAPGPRHAALRGTESGCLAIADISGYTSYLAGSELDHAQDVLEDLTETVVKALSPPMKLSQLEGDAVFVYVPGSRVDASMLLDTLDAAYFAFRRRQDAIDRATQCDCNACVLIPRLDLKFVAHHGAYGRQHVAGREDLSGSDVILVHRLLKNRIVEVTGHAGYAFYTDAVVAAMGVDPELLRMRRHAEEVEGIGSVDGWVQDLHERWSEERERRRVKVSRDDAIDVMSYVVNAPRSVTWRYLTDPGLRGSWQPGIRTIDQSTADGRRGLGTQNHCVHGRGASLEEILDWRPFDYFTIQNEVKMPLLAPMRATFELEDADGGTRVTEYTAHGPGFGQRLITRVVGRMVAGERARGHEALRAAVEADQDAPPDTAGD
ncbi:MAG: DUF2652 domain-containing protein [Chloroflexi bacterium]|nr:DUF2652 domain-containing protein [Chloroflexota bacterium]